MNPTGKSFPGTASTRFPHGFRRAPRSCRRRRGAADRRAAFVAELAAAAGRDPKDFLVEVSGTPRVVSPQMLGDTWNHGESAERYPVDTGRLRRVVAELAAREAGWRRALPNGSGLGMAAHYSFISYVAAVVEVAIDAKGELTIPRVDIAIDCGATVYPDRMRAQMQGPRRPPAGSRD